MGERVLCVLELRIMFIGEGCVHWFRHVVEDGRRYEAGDTGSYWMIIFLQTLSAIFNFLHLI